ncbi:MAG: molybdopterin-dependent oxidoreductase [Chloroflexi bacterium]|nr:molybdopterin-dependent oxidoreductase [Chloroflexota bacterium]
MSVYSVIGKRLPNIDGFEKATGSAKYTVDITLPNMLWAKILRSPHPHARILHVDTSGAEALPGVKLVVTGKDTIGKKMGNWRRFPELCDEPILCRDKVRFIGDAVAAVAAVDEDTAEEALKLIKVEYEPLKAVFDPMEAIKEDAPCVHDGVDLNINVTRHIEWGDVDEGFKQCDHIREDSFYCTSMAHVCMEPHNTVASFGYDGKLTIWTSTQSNYFVQVLLAEMLGIKEGDVRVIKPHVGGGFGGKMELDSGQFIASLLSQKLRQPVKIVFSREEVFTATRRRTPMYYISRLGAKKDGTILAREVRAVTDGGAYTSMGATTLYVTGFYSFFPYKYPAYRYDGYRVYTNMLPSSALRGFGAPQACFVTESQMDLMARDLGIDPMELRRKNAMTPNSVIPDQAFIQSCGIPQCIDKIDKFVKDKGQLPPNHGIGVAGYGFNSGGIFNWFDTPYAFGAATVKISIDGKVDLFTGANEIGQGSNTTLCMICAEELGVQLEDVRLHTGDTATCPPDLGAWASRETFMNGNAVKAAAADAKRQLLEYAAGKLGPNIVYDLEISHRWVHITNRPERGISYFDVVKEAIRARGGQQIVGQGEYTPHRKGMVSPAFSFGVQAVEVKVDPETGKVTLLSATTAHDGGTTINPLGAEGQLEGSVCMSGAYGFTEYYLHKNGKITNCNLRDYKPFRAADMPKINILNVDTYEPEGPFGAKEAGEGLAIPTPGALVNAIDNAIGVRIKEMPVTPEKILKALKEKGKEKQGEKTRKGNRKSRVLVSVS